MDGLSHTYTTLRIGNVVRFLNNASLNAEMPNVLAERSTHTSYVCVVNEIGLTFSIWGRSDSWTEHQGGKTAEPGAGPFLQEMEHGPVISSLGSRAAPESLCSCLPGSCRECCCRHAWDLQRGSSCADEVLDTSGQTGQKQ